MIAGGRKHASWWVAIVLPGFVLRALIPLGFMPMFGPGYGVRLTLCEGYAPVPSTAMDMPADMPMDMPMAVQTQGGDPGHGGNRSPGHQDHSACPYGASPTLAVPPPSTDVPDKAQPLVQSPVSAPQIAHFEIAPRAQFPRGPPLQV